MTSEPAPDVPAPEPAAPAPRFGLLRYTLVRLLVLAAVTGLLWLVGLRSNLLLLLALGLVISGFISLFVLNRARDDASASVVGMFRRMNDRIDAAARAEDDEPPPRAPES